MKQVVFRHRATNPRVFGSVAQGTDDEDSDLDLLVDPLPDTSLLDVAMIQVELETLLGVPVDVVTPNGLAAGFRDRVLDEALAL
ncbi:MAG: nucleotidyltransferase domain-containing protein [Chromatiaceae bacterium]|nr:nucleotidyltransferase domain-containing protein [Chromatiaceae bacterium]